MGKLAMVIPGRKTSRQQGSEPRERRCIDHAGPNKFQGGLVIPEGKKHAVSRALREAFGVAGCEEIHQLTAGLSTALVFRIVVKGCPYLLRVITRDDGMNDPTRQFACMKSGEEAGLAPRVWYTSIEDRISIADFVEARPFPERRPWCGCPLRFARCMLCRPFLRSSTFSTLSM